MGGAGFDVGAHTVDHVDLGRCTVEAAESEVVECGRALVRIIGKPIDLFSFPFGRVDNIRNETRQAISAAGYVALFSSQAVWSALAQIRMIFKDGKLL